MPNSLNSEVPVRSPSGPDTDASRVDPTASAFKESKVTEEVSNTTAMQSTYISPSTLQAATARTLGSAQSLNALISDPPVGVQTVSTGNESVDDTLESLVDAWPTDKEVSPAQSEITQGDGYFKSLDADTNALSSNNQPPQNTVVSGPKTTSAGDLAPEKNTELTALSAQNVAASKPITPSNILEIATTFLNTEQQAIALQSVETMLFNMSSVMAELQSLADTYLLDTVNNAQQPVVGTLMSAAALASLKAQASGKGLGSLDPTSHVYLLDTTPQTIVEDLTRAKQYHVFDMSGDIIGQMTYGEVDRWGVNLGNGQVLALGQTGFLTSTLLPGAQSRMILSGLGVFHPWVAAAAKKRLGPQKIDKISPTSCFVKERDDCATHCFLAQRQSKDQRIQRNASRCILCRVQ